MTPADSESRQSILDEEHLKLLGLGYLVSAILSAGFSVLGLVYGAMGLVFGRAIAESPDSAGQAPPEFLGWFFAIFGATFLLDVVDTVIKGEPYFDTLGIEYLIQVPIGLVLAGIAIWTVNRRFHLGLVIVHLLYQAWWISILFYTHA